MLLLPQDTEGWNYRHEAPCLTLFVLDTESFFCLQLYSNNSVFPAVAVGKMHPEAQRVSGPVKNVHVLDGAEQEEG